MDTAIEIRGVRKTFGDTVAVDDLTLDIEKGGICGFIGPNGAGKTTTIRMIMSILFPDAGRLSVLGRPSALDAKDQIGYLPEERGVYKKMKVGAFVKYMAQLKGVDDVNLDSRISEALERVGLPGIERKRCDELSKGMSQKVQFVTTILHQPDLLILDEPFSGLDPVSMRSLRDLILSEHERGATILFSTHVMPQAEEICEHVVMIYQGRKVLDESIGSIRRQYDPRALLFEPLDPDAAVGSLESLDSVEQVRPKDGAWEVRLTDGSDPSRTMRQILDTIPAARIELSRPRLEDIFIKLVAEGSSTADEERLRAELQQADIDGAAS